MRRPNPIDRKIGALLRKLREQKGVSQAELGKAARITFQQIHKYETGINRVAVSTLIKLAPAIGTTAEGFLAQLSNGA